MGDGPVEVEHWWNQSWGRLARYDIWLWSWRGWWRVQARRGGEEGSPRSRWARSYSDEATARRLVEHLKATRPTPERPFRWTNLTRPPG